MAKGSGGTRTVSSANAASSRTINEGSDNARFREIANRDGYENYLINGKSSDGQIDIIPKFFDAKETDVKYAASISFGSGKVMQKDFEKLNDAKEFIKKNLK